MRWPWLAALSVVALTAYADSFDAWDRDTLVRLTRSEQVQQVERLRAAQGTRCAGLLPGTDGAVLFVRTRNGLWAKLACIFGIQKTPAGPRPVLVIERFATFRPESGRAVQASARGVYLYDGFHFNLELGQIVPPDVGADLRYSAEAGGVLEAMPQVQIFLLVKPPKGNPATAPQNKIGDADTPVGGTFQLYDDGRRTARLHLEIAQDGTISGSYVSDRTGRTYPVRGKVQSPRHIWEFTVKFPQTEQTFRGWFFTGDGAALAGFSRMQDREFGFYAVRLPDEPKRP
ncbi:MAG: hypothetical protein C4297_13640 [Gemmataceae bacterium]